MRSILYVLGLVVIAASVQTAVSAAVPVAAPEIDGGTLASGLGLLSGGIMVLRARFRR
jgi:hypothetical protein